MHPLCGLRTKIISLKKLKMFKRSLSNFFVSNKAYLMHHNNMTNYVNTEVDSPYLVEQINYNFPSRTLRHLQTFKPAKSRLNVRKFSFLPRSMSFYNHLVCKYSSFDIFINRPAFRQTVRDILYR